METQQINTQVGLRQEQLIGVSSQIITIHRAWIQDIENEYGQIPSHIQIKKENNIIYGTFIFEPSIELENTSKIGFTGADNKTPCFWVRKNYFNIFPTIQKGRFNKLICMAELSPDYKSITWSSCSQDRLDYIRQQKKPIRVTLIKKIEKTVEFLNKMLMLSFIEIERRKSEINQHLKRLKVLDPMFRELVLL